MLFVLRWNAKGWTITADPFVLQYEAFRLFADLGAERPLAGEKGTEAVVIEVKVFGGTSQFTDLHQAIG